MFVATLNEATSSECVILLSNEGSRIRISAPAELCELASILGWVACDCGMTDGSDDCEHRTADAMLQEAVLFLNSCKDAAFELPLGSRILNSHFW